MKKTATLLFIISNSFICIFSCQQEIPKKEVKKPKAQFTKNPNGDSELALLMREMYWELESIQAQIENNEKIALTVDHEKILTAHATEPEKAASPEFKAFAKQYLTFVEELDKAEPQKLQVHYENLLSSCLSCHQQLCPGPMMRIQKLKL